MTLRRVCPSLQPVAIVSMPYKVQSSEKTNKKDKTMIYVRAAHLLEEFDSGP